MKKGLSVILILVLLGLAGPVSSRGEDCKLDQPPAKFYSAVPDLILARPLLAFGSLAPTFVFAATLPLSYPLEQDLKAVRYLVQKPWNYTADRPLGVFVQGKDCAKRVDESISKQYQEYFVQVGEIDHLMPENRILASGRLSNQYHKNSGGGGGYGVNRKAWLGGWSKAKK